MQAKNLQRFLSKRRGRSWKEGCVIRNGVRPSSGAARFALRKAWEISDPLVCANAAAPEDGSTPIRSGKSSRPAQILTDSSPAHRQSCSMWCDEFISIASLEVGCWMFGVGCFAAVRFRLRRDEDIAPDLGEPSRLSTPFHKYDHVCCAAFGFWRGATREHSRQRSVTEEQQSQKPNATQPSGRRFFLAQTSLLAPYGPLKGMRVARASSGPKTPRRKRGRIYETGYLAYSTHVSLSTRGTSGGRVGEHCH